MRRNNKYKSEESKQREQAHWFGREGGNIPCPMSIAREQRLFYKWVFTEATEQELADYIASDDVPCVRKKFIESILKSKKVSDFCEVTNQIYGLPRQTIEMNDLPKIDLQVFDLPKEKINDV